MRRCPVKLSPRGQQNLNSTSTSLPDSGRSASPLSVPNSVVEGSAQPLPIIPFEGRPPILIPLATESVNGWPMGEDLSADKSELRELYDWRCREMAFRVSPIGSEIDKHVEWLIQNRAASSTLIEAMKYQSSHARGEHVAQSMNVFLNLANLYTQQPTILESHQEIDRSLRAVKKIRAADIQLSIDERQFERQHLDIDEQSTVLLQQQTALTHGLEQLLDLQPASQSVWTVAAPVEHRQDFSPGSEVELAFSQRGDLLAIEVLARHPESVTTEQLAFLATGGSALMPAKLPLPKITSLLERIVKRKVREKLAQLSKLETERRREQLEELAATKRRIIKKEIANALAAIDTSQKILRLKQKKLTSLEKSIRAAETAKDELPLDAEQHLKNRLAAAKLKSEIIDKSFAIAIEMNQLKRARGDYSTQGSHE